MPTVIRRCDNCEYRGTKRSRCFYHRKLHQEIHYPLLTAFRGAVRLNKRKLAEKILDMEDSQKKFLIGWSRDRCLAYAVYKKAFKVAEVLLHRGADKSALTDGYNDFDQHYYHKILFRVVVKNDVELFTWLMTQLKPEDFQKDVVEEAFDEAFARKKPEIGALLIAHFPDVLGDLKITDDEWTVDAGRTPPSESDSESSIDADDSDTEFGGEDSDSD